jgi:ATP-dependent helicase Lhr and Lhr-like helicase
VPRVQRIGLSATVRPAREAAEYLGGAHGRTFHPVTIVDATTPRRLELRVETPVDPPPRHAAPPRRPASARGARDAALGMVGHPSAPARPHPNAPARRSSS